MNPAMPMNPFNDKAQNVRIGNKAKHADMEVNVLLRMVMQN